MDSISNIAVRTHLQEVTIGKMEADDIIKPLQATILTVSQRLGIKITAIEVQDLSRFICQHFKDFNIKEIPVAFDLLNARKFDVKNGHYGIFGQSYMGDVLTEYRKYRIEETRKSNIKITQLENQKNTLTKEQIIKKNYEAMKEGVLSSWEYFKENSTMEREPSNDIVSAHHYDWLRNNEILETPSEELVREIKKEAHEYLSEQIKNDQLNASRHELKHLLEESKHITGSDKHKVTCKKIAVRIYFEDLLFNELELQTIINK